MSAVMISIDRFEARMDRLPAYTRADRDALRRADDLPAAELPPWARCRVMKPQEMRKPLCVSSWL